MIELALLHCGRGWGSVRKLEESEHSPSSVITACHSIIVDGGGAQTLEPAKSYYPPGEICDDQTYQTYQEEVTYKE